MVVSRASVLLPRSLDALCQLAVHRSFRTLISPLARRISLVRAMPFPRHSASAAALPLQSFPSEPVAKNYHLHLPDKKKAHRMVDLLFHWLQEQDLNL